MTKRNIGQEILEGLKEAVEFMEGKATNVRVSHVHVPEEDLDVKVLREELGLSQREFADAYGFSVHAVRKWEQGQRTPEKPTRLLLMMIRDMPDVVNRYLQLISEEGSSGASLA
ncbi:MAG: helix-turn-helix domain-containing protein [Bradymonadaceae bacterium]|nr:helix-turn-helix domain-containing protein [Lujinxingiaceae bacterium]